MQVTNVKIYDLEESIVASAYPMKVDLEDYGYEVNNLKYWMEYDIYNIMKILKMDDRFYLEGNDLYMKVADIVTKISPEDLCEISKLKWTYDGRYVNDIKGEVSLHRFILDDCEIECVDHIDRDKLNNTRDNLRGANYKENGYNREVNSNNTSGVIGVSFRNDRNKWRAYINVDGNQISLGSFNNINDAIYSRLVGEIKYCGKFSPQKHLFEEYGLKLDIDNKFEPKISHAISRISRCGNLGSTPKGSGHDQLLTGIRVNFDLKCSNKMWIEMERYRFIEFVSSQSTMHRITQFDIREQCNCYVWESTIRGLNKAVALYNDLENKNTELAISLYLQILYNTPSGFELTARLATNYRALKTVYSQRKNHPLPEWRDFCQWIEKLPYFREMILEG